MSFTIEEIKQLKFGRGQSAGWFMDSWKNEIKFGEEQSEWFLDRNTFHIQRFDKYGNPIK